jgi:hypothetical protein
MALLRRSLFFVAFVVVAWLLVVAFALAFGGCGGGGLGVTPTGPAVQASACFSSDTAGMQPKAGPVAVGMCRSPDGAWRATANPGKGCEIEVTRTSAGRPIRRSTSHDSSCSELIWAAPHLLLFLTDSAFYTWNPATRLPGVTSPAAFTEFVVSPNRRWFAGDGVTGAPVAPQTKVYVFSADGSTCVMVPLGRRQTDEVAGFTRDSKSLIVDSSAWNGTSSPPAGVGGTGLRQFRLSSLHTECDGSEFGA